MGKVNTNSYVRPVYFRAGEVNGQQMFRRAPFDVVITDGKTLIQPRSIGPGDQAYVQMGRDSAEDVQNWRDHDLGGYETLQPIVIEEHQMGDGSDNWMGLHKLSNV